MGLSLVTGFDDDRIRSGEYLMHVGIPGAPQVELLTKFPWVGATWSADAWVPDYGDDEDIFDDE